MFRCNLPTALFAEWPFFYICFTCHCGKTKFKKKSDCTNYLDITPLSTASRILAHNLLNRLIPTIAQENMPVSQCRFRSNRGTTDMIFVLRRIQKKCRQQSMHLYAAFVDQTKAFDTVSRDGQWKTLAVWLSPQISPHPPPVP